MDYGFLQYMGFSTLHVNSEAYAVVHCAFCAAPGGPLQFASLDPLSATTQSKSLYPQQPTLNTLKTPKTPNPKPPLKILQFPAPIFGPEHYPRPRPFKLEK